MDRRKCKNCKWFDKMFDNQGICRLRPPQIRPTPLYGAWPTVHPNDWCGEFYETWSPGEVKSGTK